MSYHHGTRSTFPAIANVGDKMTSETGIHFTYVEGGKGANNAWIPNFTFTIAGYTPPERDVPHWAASNVAAFRIAYDLPAIITDRMIFAAMVKDTTKSDNEEIPRLKEWANKQEPVNPMAQLRQAMNGITRDNVQCFKEMFEDCGKLNVIDEYQRIATKSAIYPGQGTPLGLAYVALKLNGEAGEFAEHVGKAMRDDALITSSWQVGAKGLRVEFDTPLTPERRALIIKEVGDVLWYLSAACNELGIKLSNAATENLEKLCDRTERDALHGSGDNR